MSDCCLTVYAKSPGLAMVPGKNLAIHARGATALCNCFVDKLLELKLSCGGGRKSRAYSLIFRYPLSSCGAQPVDPALRDRPAESKDPCGLRRLSSRKEASRYNV